jgi:hypothetical protein
MQRRAAAVAAAVLLIVAAGGYVFVGFAQEPTVDVEGDEYAVGDSLTVEGQTYTVADIGEDEATIEWTNDSARQTAELENATNVTYQEETYHLTVDRDGTEPPSFTLEEILNVTQILQNDPEVENTVLRTGEGAKYVRYRANDSTRPLEEYLPTRTTHAFAEGDQYPYENETTTVDTVTNESVTLTWTAAETMDVSATEGSNVTLGSTRYLAHFPDNSTLVLTQNYDGYESEQQRIAYYQERIDGLWGVSILSTLAALVLIGAAYLPSRY